MEWLKKIKYLIVSLPSRISEPSTWAGVGVVLLGIAIALTGGVILGAVTIAAGGIAIFLNERSE